MTLSIGENDKILKKNLGKYLLFKIFISIMISVIRSSIKTLTIFRVSLLDIIISDKRKSVNLFVESSIFSEWSYVSSA